MTICVLHLSQYILNLYARYLNDLKFFIMVTYTIFQAYVTHVNLEIAFYIQVNVSNKPCLYLFECWHRFSVRGLFKYECKLLHNFRHIYVTTKMIYVL